MEKKPALVAAVIIIVALLIFFSFKFSKALSVEVVSPVIGEAVQAVYATGLVEASVMMPIAARNTASLIELNVDEGSKVKKGDILARLDDEDLKNTISELEAKERYAKQEYDRKVALAEQGYSPKALLEQAKSDWDAAKAALARAKTEANFMRLVSPADGQIIRRDGEIGQLIPANQPVFWMSCCAPLRISTEVDEEDIALVQPGQKVLIHADAFPDRVFNG